MGIAIQLNQKLYDDAKKYANVNHRSASKQVEHWAVIGRIAEDNPDLSYNAIKDILLGLEEYYSGNIEPFDPKSL